MPARFRNFLIVIALIVAVVGTTAFSLAFEGTINEATDAIVPDLVINEAMTSNKTAVPDFDGQFSDYVEIYNRGENAIDMSGYSLSDDNMEPSKYPLPERDLQPGEHILVFCVGQDRTGRYPEYAPFRLSASGESVGIYDNGGMPLYTVTLPTMSSNQAYLRAEDDTWSVSGEYSPALPNTTAGHDEFMATRLVTNKTIVINELMSSNDYTYPDSTGGYNDWLELRNVSQETVDLSGWGLTDDPGNAGKWVFPESTVLQPGEYLLIYCVNETEQPVEKGGALYASFGLSSNGEEVSLFDEQIRLVDSVVMPELETDVSYARGFDDYDTWETTVAPTPGLPNNEEGEQVMSSMVLAANPGIYINEVLAQTRATHTDFNAPPDWIELYNATNNTIDLTGWGLTDKKKAGRFVFPEFTISPGEYKVLNCDGDFTETLDEDDNVQVTFGFSANETIMLTDAEDNLVQRLLLPWTPGGVSYGREPGQEGASSGGFFYYENPTPGGVNDGNARNGIVDMPSFNVEGGQYSGSVMLTINAPEGSAVYYTTDAYDPTTESARYSDSITLDKTTVVRARAFKDGYVASPIETHTYFIDVEHTLPIISLVTDPDNLYSDEKGLFVMGSGGGPGTDYPDSPFGRSGAGANFWLEWEHKAHIEMIFDGEMAISQNVGLRLNGQYSRSEDQKALGIYAREDFEEGQDKLRYPLFENKPFTEYSAVVLRASGQDWQYSRIRDMVETQLARGTTVLYQEATPAMLYINGEFFSQYNIRERINTDFIIQNEGLREGTMIDISKGDSAQQGNRDEYRDLREHILDEWNLDINDPERLQYVLDRVDVDNLFEYNLIEAYTGNADNGNVRYYKPRLPGAKWRWILFDLDWGFWVDTSPDSNSLTRNGFTWILHPDGTGSGHRFDNNLIRALTNVPEYRDIFLTKAGDALRGRFSTENVLALIDHYAGILAPEMPFHYAKWREDDPEDGVADWEARVNNLRRFARERPGYMLEQAREHFDLSDAEMEKYFHDVVVYEEDGDE